MHLNLIYGHLSFDLSKFFDALISSTHLLTLTIGVASKKAFFARAAKNAGADTTKTNEQKIKEEAAQRRQLREAAAAEKAAK